jgi:putative membrane protein
MAGAMRKIWPWKEVIEERIVRGKAHVIMDQNILPSEINTEFFIALGLMVTGFLIVIVLDRVSKEKVEEGLGN